MEPEPPVELPPWAWTVLVAAAYVPVSAGCILWLWWRIGPEALMQRLFGEAPLRDLLLGALVGVVVAALSRWFTRRLGVARRLARAMSRAIGPMSLFTCVLFATFSSVGEELLFRGVLQPWLGWLPTTVLFAAAHVPTERDLLPWPLFALLAGALLAGLFELTGALVAPVACHFVINLLNLRALGSMAGQDEEEVRVRKDGLFQ